MDNLNQKSSETPSASPVSEDITSSISSEVFESWTLVSDKNKAAKKAVAFAAEAQEAGEEDSDGSANRVEILNSDPEENESSKSNLETQTKTTDDLSDGISVISDSESELRNPEPNVRLRFSTTDIHEIPSTSHVMAHDSSSESHQVSRLRRRRSSDPSTGSVKSSVEVKNRRSFPAIRSGLTGLFYVGAILAILGFIGKLRYPEWDTSSTIETLEAKLNDLENHNNLMRAEVDILSKQVDYLTSFTENQQHYKSKGENSLPRKEQHRNNQRQNGQNAKKPFRNAPKVANGAADMWNEQLVKCDIDKVYNDIAGVCVDRLDNEIPISNYVSQNAGEGVPQNFKNFEDKIHKLEEKLSKEEQAYKQAPSSYSKDGEKRSNSGDKENIPLKPYNGEKRHDKNPNVRNDEKYNSRQNSPYPEKNHQYHDSSDKHNRNKNVHDQKYQRHHKENHHDGSGDNHYNKGKKFEQHYDQSHHKNGKHYDFDDKHSKDKKFEQHNYRPHHKNDENENSKEKFDQNKHRIYEDHDDGKYKYQPRESFQKFDERQRDGKNWYIARGDGRQQARFTGGRRRR